PYLSQDTGDKSEEKKTAIALIQKYSLAGDYINAEHQLNEYKNKYGEDDQYLTEQARYFALTHQSARALDLIKPLLQKYPDNKTLLDIKNYALTHPASSADLTTPAVSAGSQSASYSKSVQF